MPPHASRHVPKISRSGGAPTPLRRALLAPLGATFFFSFFLPARAFVETLTYVLYDTGRSHHNRRGQRRVCAHTVPWLPVSCSSTAGVATRYQVPARLYLRSLTYAFTTPHARPPVPACPPSTSRHASPVTGRASKMSLMRAVSFHESPVSPLYSGSTM